MIAFEDLKSEIMKTFKIQSEFEELMLIEFTSKTDPDTYYSAQTQFQTFSRNLLNNSLGDLLLYIIEQDDLIVNLIKDGKKTREVFEQPALVSSIENAQKEILSRAKVATGDIWFTAEKVKYELKRSFDVFKNKFTKIKDIYVYP